MKSTAYIQKVKGEFPNTNFLTAYIGLKRFFGYDIKFFEDVEEILDYVTKDTPVYGGIPVMNKVFAKLGVNPVVPYYPDELEPFFGRPIYKRSVKVVRLEIDAGASYFVKPLETQKKTFTGKVMSKFLDLLHMHHLDDDDEVWCSRAIIFVSEYRVYVHRKDGILGCKHYAGDWKVPPDYAVIDAMVAAYKSAPVAYSLDVGVTAAGRTLLVECNDATSLGTYGLDASLYGCMIVDRWKEIMGNVG